MRKMTSRYNGRCKRCRASFTAGSEIYWSKASGALCLSCGAGERSETETETPKASGNSKPSKTKAPANKSLPGITESGRDEYFTLEWPVLRNVVKQALQEGKVSACKRQANATHILRHTQGATSWNGYTAGQLERWVTQGYDTETLKGLGEFTPPLREKRRYRYSDDGEEILVDRALSGDDDYYGEWTKRENIPGVAIEAEIMFCAGVSPEIVNAYNVFICQALFTLEAEGIDCQVTLKFSSDDAASDGKFQHSIVRVKKENEATDFRSFSAMLSPAALRAFGFTALILHSEAKGMTASGSLGRGNPSAKEWKVEWDSERRVLKFDCPYMGDRSFPAEEMQRKLKAALHAMKSAN